ncbi:MAG: lamin tail domain-containing protein [Fibrobacter sp.]|nr:lamin tail domain-containing protein [Fibrobacter sp.]
MISSVSLTKQTCCLILLSGLLAGCAIVNPPDDVPARGGLTDLTITEINYNPLPEAGILEDSLEFIELFNKSSSEVSLKGVAFDDGIDFIFESDASIGPGEYIVIASSAEDFRAKYGFEPFGEYTGNLKNSGERIALRDLSAGKDFLSVEYSDVGPWPEKADGLGFSIVPVSSEGQWDLKSPYSWRASTRIGGSPGKADPTVVYVNEVLTHTDPPDEDAIELYNPGNVPVDISGWFLTDKKSNPKKFRIPDGNVIEAKGYKVFYSHEFSNASLPYPFNLDANGEEVYLFADSTDFINGFSHGFPFDAIENGVSFGRILNSSGQQRFTTLDQVTLGKANSGPALSKVVITEIMYNPQNGRDEYVEIKNTGSKTVFFYDPLNPENTWILKGFGFVFPADASLESGKSALIITDTIPADTFRSLYNVPSDAVIYNGANGGLRNSGDTLTLMSPEEPFSDGYETVVPFKVIERVEYTDKGLWPVSADGEGASLVRRDNGKFSDDPANWIEGKPGPGR